MYIKNDLAKGHFFVAFMKYGNKVDVKIYTYTLFP